MHFPTWAALPIILTLTGTALAASDVTSPSRPPQTGGGFQGTAEEQAACAPDAAKFCMDAIPDTFRVLACLQSNRTKLRKVCLHVLESHNM